MNAAGASGEGVGASVGSKRGRTMKHEVDVRAVGRGRAGKIRNRKRRRHIVDRILILGRSESESHKRSHSRGRDRGPVSRDGDT